MTKLSDYVVDYLIDSGVDTVFTVSGGGIMHLTDSLGKRQDKIGYLCNYHEQACAIAAEAYARARHRVGVCLVTTGPGSTNALSSIAGAWVDSVPVVVISGQVRTDLIADYSRVRQMGPQEINILDMVKPVTKYAATITDASTIKDELEKAFRIAQSGRPGPVWLNLPLDIQSAQIDLPPAEPQGPDRMEPEAQNMQQLKTLLSKATRPLLVLGNGIHLAGGHDLIGRLKDQLGIPAVLAWGGLDLLDENDPLNAGRFGPLGHRHANFAVQTSDFLLSIGSSMSVSNIGFSTDTFSPDSIKIIVNSDPGEIEKMRPVPDLAIQADCKCFIEAMLAQTWDTAMDPRWLPTIQEWKGRYPTVPDYRLDTQHVDSYVFVDRLSAHLHADDLILTGNGLDAWSLYQCLKVKKGQRAFTNINFGAMGWDLPACVGGAVAQRGKRTILMTGDGSVQMNVQELLTLGFNKLNTFVFVLNNGGYESIRATQNNHFGGHLVGADASSGVANPDFELLARANGLRYFCIANHEQLERELGTIMQNDGPVLCELKLSYHQSRSPRVMSRKREDGKMESASLQNMFPFLPPEEIQVNMNRFSNQD
ncbi:thiamine pyrophosphate-binding protein [Herbaspirillum frisingense]|uniref:thiamine pyrophosphate-binding protein n=1 Tax=Herbaspirillum frisingense TaxID=92645 RepID=UPI0039AF1A96